MNILWVKRISHGSVKHEITQLLVFTIFYADAQFLKGGSVLSPSFTRVIIQTDHRKR